MNEIKRGIYQHYKGERFEVWGLASYREDPEVKLVVYRSLDSEDNLLLTQPWELFTDAVLVDGKKLVQYKFISENNIIIESSGESYEDKNGNRFEFIDIALNIITGAEMVVYRREEELWITLREIFFGNEPVENSDQTIPRFKKVS